MLGTAVAIDSGLRELSHVIYFDSTLIDLSHPSQTYLTALRRVSESPVWIFRVTTTEFHSHHQHLPSPPPEPPSM